MISKVAGFSVPDDVTADSSEVAQRPLGMTQEELWRLAESIVVMVPHTGLIHADLAINFPEWGRLGTMHALNKSHSGFIEVTRAGMARRFLELCDQRPHLKFCVMIDSDQGVPIDAPFRLAVWDRPVVSGVVCSWEQHRGITACFWVKDKHGVGRRPSMNYTGTMPAEGLVEAHRVGTGLVCIRKDVFEALDQAGEIPFYIPEDVRKAGAIAGTMKQGEDVIFSAQCEKAGFKLYADLSLHATHYKAIPLTWPKRNLDPSLDPRVWDVSEHDQTY